jgi:hypothetical protein
MIKRTITQQEAQEMLELLAEANILWVGSTPDPKSTGGRILEMLSRFGMDKEPEPEYLGTAADLIRF